MNLLNRRKFLIASTSIVGATLAGIASARDYQGGIPWESSKALPPDRYAPSQRFLTTDEHRFITHAVDRLIPADAFPSASQLGVVDFIDHQLAGSYGRGDIFYLQAPFFDGTKSQGYQSRAPSWLYRRAIREIEAVIASEHDGKTFADLEETEQDTVRICRKLFLNRCGGIDAPLIFRCSGHVRWLFPSKALISPRTSSFSRSSFTSATAYPIAILRKSSPNAA
ncbi:gluconate 2-dehydrogenase subunit 3 family protein [uncultured Nitratireductor sp.]|uniref:gluconate 2-dehydrogenase subunit 3 family protein n=1 Tax=uncultured Nitratireductor sp. TaxID=520953 RepID=UPI00262B69EA|nr:gluconate 2-dehydrogenase subunit 3 family protein [uncultured Nitratireductor sp.]